MHLRSRRRALSRIICTIVLFRFLRSKFIIGNNVAPAHAEALIASTSAPTIHLIILKAGWRLEEGWSPFWRVNNALKCIVARSKYIRRSSRFDALRGMIISLHRLQHGLPNYCE